MNNSKTQEEEEEYFFSGVYCIQKEKQVNEKLS